MISEICMIIIASVLVCFLIVLIIWNLAIYKAVRKLQNILPHRSHDVLKIDRELDKDVKKLTKDMKKKREHETEEDDYQNSTIPEIIDWSVKTICLFNQLKRYVKQYGKSNR